MPDPALLDEARRELRELLDGLRGDLARYLYLSGRVRPQLRAPLDEAVKDVRHAFTRLCALLGLSERERAFVSALADDAADFDFIQVFADWLEEEGRARDGARVRRLVPRDGDVLLFTVAPGPDALQEGRACEGAARHLAGVLAARGVRCTPVIVYQGTEVHALPQQTMRAAGWVRVTYVRRVLRDFEDDLARTRSPVDGPTVLRHVRQTCFPMPEDA